MIDPWLRQEVVKSVEWMTRSRLEPPVWDTVDGLLVELAAAIRDGDGLVARDAVVALDNILGRVKRRVGVEPGDDEAARRPVEVPERVRLKSASVVRQLLPENGRDSRGDSPRSSSGDR